MTQLASSAVHTAVRSSDGSAWHSEPPIVPRLRTTGSAITCSASAKIGNTAASSGDSSSSRCRVMAPMRTSSTPDAHVAELVVQVVDVDEVLEVGQPQLHHRDQAVAAGDQSGFLAEPVQQADRVVHARGALVVERCGYLHWNLRVRWVTRLSVRRAGPVNGT